MLKEEEEAGEREQEIQDSKIGMEKDSEKEVVSGVRENEDWAKAEFGQSRT